MARLPIATRDMAPDEFREAFDGLTRDTGGTIAGGPYSLAVNSPEMAWRRSNLTNYLRFETAFSKRIQELAILTTARAFDCPYIWNAQAPAARREGVSDALVDAIRDRKPLPAMADDEGAIVNYCNGVLQKSPHFGVNFPDRSGAIRSPAPGGNHRADGNYGQTAFFLNAFEVELPTERTEPVLPVG